MDNVLKSIATIPREPRASEALGSFVPEGAGSRDAGEMPTRAHGPGQQIYSEANPFVTGVSSSGIGAVGAADATAWNAAANPVAYGPNFGRDPSTTPFLSTITAHNGPGGEIFGTSRASHGRGDAYGLGNQANCPPFYAAGTNGQFGSDGESRPNFGFNSVPNVLDDFGAAGSRQPPQPPPPPPPPTYSTAGPSPPFVPQGAGVGGLGVEPRLGDVLMKLKGEDVPELKYTSGSNKPVEFENWVRKVRMNLDSRHSQLVSWWNAVYESARAAYARYLALSPLQRADIRPEQIGMPVTIHHVERYMRRYIVNAVPYHIQQTLLQLPSVSCPGVPFQTMVDAGPGTAADRARTLAAVGQKGPAVPVHAIHERLQRWRFDMVRLATLGVSPPDPRVQMSVILHYVAKLSEGNTKFDYRLNAYCMTHNLQGAITQAQVEALWRYLVAEAREVHGTGPKESGKRASASIVPEGAGGETAKRMDGAPSTEGKGKGKGKGKGIDAKASDPNQERNQPQAKAKAKAKAKAQTKAKARAKSQPKKGPCTFFNNGTGCKTRLRLPLQA